MPERPPATDWTTDFDHTDARWIDDPFPIWRELRNGCPIAHTERYGGVYLPTRYEDVRAIAYDTTNFSSRRVVIRENPPDVPLPSPPITSDPPHHKPSRMLLLPAFSPQVIERLVPRTRAICNELLDAIDGRSECDAAAEYTQHIPVRVIAHMLGVPEEEGDRFRRWIHVFLEDTIVDDDKRAAERLMATALEMDDYFRPYVEARRRAPGEDLISFLVQAQHDGQPLTERHLFGTLRLILIAGIDTTWSAIGASLWHLARTPADRDRLVAEPDLMATAVEEFLRAYAPVTMARQVVNDTEVGGCPMKAGQLVMLSFPAANRDPQAFPDPDSVIIDRQDNRHAAFGLGIHRCIGSNLARMEINVALQEWLRRIPRFSLKDASGVIWSRGAVRGPRTLPFVLGN
ncbi:MAG: cytochrome P450 [Bacteroidota bacterium]